MAERRSLLDTVPAWIQALTAIAGLAVAVFGINFVANPPPEGPSGTAEVRLLTSSIGEELTGSGDYLRLKSSEQEIVLLVRLAGQSDWTPIEVTREPSNVDPATQLEDGRWSASAPLSAAGATFLPIVVDQGVLGLGGTQLEELRVEGSGASFVIAAGTATEVSAAPAAS